MKKNNRASWTARAGLVASLAVVGVLGTTVPAQAASPVTVSAGAAPVSLATPVSGAVTDVRIVSGATGGASTGSGTNQADARSWATILRAAKEAIKKVPAVWNKAVSSAKKGYATFVKTAWPSIKLLVNVISYSITAWDIWNLFR